MKEKKELMPFEIGLETTKKRLEKANKAMKNVEKYLAERDIEKVFNSAFDFANESEKLTILARILPALIRCSSIRLPIPGIFCKSVFMVPLLIFSLILIF